jgi:predicted transcriptional regulator
VATVLGDESRRAVLRRLQQLPGLTKAQLQRQLGISWTTASYHLRVLERQGRLTHERRGRSTHWYVRDIPPSHRFLLAVLRGDGQQHLLQRILARPNRGLTELSRESGQSRKVVRRQLRHLVDAGLVSKSDGFRARYVAPPSPLEPRLGLEVEAAGLPMDEGLSPRRR